MKDALAALLDGGDGCFARAALAAVAQRFTVCPFELGLDLSTWCDVVIGDYNYLFDPVVKLRRFFDAAGDWLFLIDEAHNLPDRARAMYSAAFAKSALTDAKRALGPGKSALKTALQKADRAFREARQAVARKAPRRGSRTDEAPAAETEQTSLLEPAREPAFALPETLFAEDGTVFCTEPPTALLKPLLALTAPLQAYLEDHPDSDAHAQLLDLFFAVQDVTRAAERYDEHFVTQLTARGSELYLHLLCLDPAPFVDGSLAKGRTRRRSSAPPSLRRATTAACWAPPTPGPWPCPVLFRLSGWGSTACPPSPPGIATGKPACRPLSDALARTGPEPGGQLSGLLPQLHLSAAGVRGFRCPLPGHPHALAQESGMDDAGRADFLARICAPTPPRLCWVLGCWAAFSARGWIWWAARLIGCAIVGVGLPQVNPRQEMLRRYYDAQAGCGFDYAYRYPGMNKVLQAAGRVIRTPEDKGVVLLLDDRFALQEYARLFPPHWQHLQMVRSQQALPAVLHDFWSQK